MGRSKKDDNSIKKDKDFGRKDNIRPKIDHIMKIERMSGMSYNVVQGPKLLITGVDYEYACDFIARNRSEEEEYMIVSEAYATRTWSK